MQIFIANITKQAHDFTYRKREVNKLVTRPISAGGQILIDTDKDEIDFIIEQAGRYGMVHHKEIRNGKNFNGLAYNFDKPLNIEAIKAGIQHNDEVMEAVALEARQNAAVATDSALQDVARNGGAKVSGLEVEITEVKRQGDNSEPFHQTVAVSDQTGKPSRRRRN